MLYISQCVFGALSGRFVVAWQELRFILSEWDFLHLIRALIQEDQVNMPLSFSVISLGSAVPVGRFEQVFSSHNSVLNLIWDQQVISVCSSSISPGVNRINLDCVELPEISSLEVLPERILINDQLCHTEDMQIYTAPSFSCPVFPGYLKSGLEQSARFLKDNQPVHSVPYLLDSGSEISGGFEQALAASYRSGYQHFIEGRYLEGLSCFKGKGYGLTPGGDDFISGFVLGLSWAERCLQAKKTSNLRDTLLRESVSGNQLTNTQFQQAYDLQVDGDWSCYLKALGTDAVDTELCLKKITSIGATSGYDAICGFLAVLEMI